MLQQRGIYGTTKRNISKIKGDGFEPIFVERLLGFVNDWIFQVLNVMQQTTLLYMYYYPTWFCSLCILSTVPFYSLPTITWSLSRQVPVVGTVPLQHRTLSQQRRTKCHNKDVWQEQFPTHEGAHMYMHRLEQQHCWDRVLITDYVRFWSVGDKWETSILRIKTLSILFHFLICNQLDIQTTISSNLTRQGFD